MIKLGMLFVTLGIGSLLLGFFGMDFVLLGLLDALEPGRPLRARIGLTVAGAMLIAWGIDRGE